MIDIFEDKNNLNKSFRNNTKYTKKKKKCKNCKDLPLKLNSIGQSNTLFFNLFIEYNFRILCKTFILCSIKFCDLKI